MEGLLLAQHYTDGISIHDHHSVVAGELGRRVKMAWNIKKCRVNTAED